LKTAFIGYKKKGGIIILPKKRLWGEDYLNIFDVKTLSEGLISNQYA
jgi:hypothetical protein